MQTLPWYIFSTQRIWDERLSADTQTHISFLLSFFHSPLRLPFLLVTFPSMWMPLSPISQQKIKALRCEYSKMTGFPKLHPSVPMLTLVSFIDMSFLLAKGILLHLYSEFHPWMSPQVLCFLSNFSLFFPLPDVLSLFISFLCSKMFERQEKKGRMREEQICLFLMLCSCI